MKNLIKRFIALKRLKRINKLKKIKKRLRHHDPREIGMIYI